MLSPTLWFHRLSSPPYFFRIAPTFARWLRVPGLILIAAGLVWGLAYAPADYQQGDGFRIIYVHVPSAWLSMFAYVFMAGAAAIGLIWRIKLAHLVAHGCAPLGAAFTALALVSGSLWGIPMWGTWWEWDARMTSELLLLFLYLGYMALHRAFEDPVQGDRAAALLAVVGVINVPIIHYSVKWWNTLHQGSTLSITQGKAAIGADMAIPLLMVALGCTLFFGAQVLSRARTSLVEREGRATWLREALEERR